MSDTSENIHRNLEMDTPDNKSELSKESSKQSPHLIKGSNSMPFSCPYATTKKKWRHRHPLLFWGGFLFILLSIMNVAMATYNDSSISGSKIAVVNIEGTIMSSEEINNWIEKISKNNSVKGVLVRIDSPGGAVGASQEIYLALNRLAKIKPLVVSMGSLAASGGYYAALPGRKIYAAPSTVTGSIGVKMQLVNAEGLMKLIGVTPRTLTTGDLKDAGSPFRAMTEKEQEYLQNMIVDMYNEFVEAVAKHRKMSIDKVKEVADGRGLTGKQALNVGLVDAIGDKTDALNDLASLCGLSSGEYRLIVGPVKERNWLQGIVNSALNFRVEQSIISNQPTFLY